MFVCCAWFDVRAEASMAEFGVQSVCVVMRSAAGVGPGGVNIAT